MALPHIQNSEAGRNKYDAVFQSLFEVYFTLPEALRAKYGKDEALLTEHVQKISGLEALTASPEVVTQKFMGTTRTFLKPKLDDTSFEIEVELSINLRNKTDNYVFKLFRDWAKLGYNLDDGSANLKKDYTADWLKCSIANAAGDIYREVIFHDVILFGGVTGWSEENYESNDPFNITVKFKSDWAEEINA